MEIKRWYATNNQTKLDRQLSYYDVNDCALGHYCAPVNLGNYHWVVLDVVLPNHDFNNGYVGITDHSPIIEVEKELEKVRFIDHSTYYAKMWAAKYFGIYHMDSNPLNSSAIYLGYHDTNVNNLTKRNLILNTHVPHLITLQKSIQKEAFSVMVITVVFGF